MNSHKLIHCLILVFVLGLLGCTKDNNKNTITECIGTVVEETSMNRLPNVKVSVTNGNRVLVSTVTDPNGAFSIIVDFEKVTERDSLLLDGSPELPYQRKYELKGMGKEQYDYRTLFLYSEPNYELKTFQYAGTTYYVHPEIGAMSWNSAMTFCDNLTYAGYSDWFLPDKDELYAMFIYKDDIGGFVTSSYQESRYWSSTTTYFFDGQYYHDDSFNYWYIDFSTGHPGYDYNQYNTVQDYVYYRVRPMRKDNRDSNSPDNIVKNINSPFE